MALVTGFVLSSRTIFASEKPIYGNVEIDFESLTDGISENQKLISWTEKNIVINIVKSILIDKHLCYNEYYRKIS